MTRNLDNHLIARGPIGPTMNVADARRLARAFWAERGVTYSYMLTKPDDNAKLAKSAVPTYGLSLSPANVSKSWNTCPWSTALCRRGCLNTAGKGGMDKVQRGRVLKTLFAGEHPEALVSIVATELRYAVANHSAGRILMRLNVLSDLSWEEFAPELFEIPGVDFYDYTKNYARYSAYLRGELPSNYRLTLSASERLADIGIESAVKNGATVAMVFDGSVPDRWRGAPVINGDLSDNRFDDPRGVIVGLKAKGRMRDRSYVDGGFVRRADESVPTAAPRATEATTGPYDPRDWSGMVGS